MARRQGLSPHVRGAAIDVPKASIAPGIIPACAGSSSRQSRRAPAGRDHPRACGEQELPRCGAVDDLGIIPARAENSLWRRPSRQGSRDHPRACGEQVFLLRAFVIEPESSPRGRGAAAHRADDSYGLGIIPACADSSSTMNGLRTTYEDHPRVCREQYVSLRDQSSVWGSSPRVRGAARSQEAVSRREGIIPACAGSSPRTFFNADIPGSSPRVRGAGDLLAGQERELGIIPVCAGSS